MSDRSRRLEDQARHELEDAGFQFVRTQVTEPGDTKKRFAADVVAWAADSSGKVRLYAVVEVKERDDPALQEGALARLSLARDMLGTTAHCIFAGGTWYEADGGLRSAHLLPGPPSPPANAATTLDDIEVVSQILFQRAWEQANRNRDFRPGPAGREAGMLEHLLHDLHSSPGRVPFGQHEVDVAPVVLWEAVQRVTRWVLGRARLSGECMTVSDLTAPMARLLGREVHGTVLDPFAGIGSSLWAAADWARGNGDGSQANWDSVELRGMEINADTHSLARALGEFSPYRLTFGLADSLRTGPVGCADYVVSEPPGGLRLTDPYHIEDVGSVRDGDVACIEVALRALRPGGRAVLHLPLGWTFRSGATERYRAHLLEAAKVVAIIGLPPGAYPASIASVASVLFVVDALPGTGETFVANLDEDWPAQLSPEGAALSFFYELAGRV
jgi:SAM-dependent methyltransferase